MKLSDFDETVIGCCKTSVQNKSKLSYIVTMIISQLYVILVRFGYFRHIYNIQ